MTYNINMNIFHDFVYPEAARYLTLFNKNLYPQIFMKLQ